MESNTISYWLVRPPDRPPLGLACPTEPGFPQSQLIRARVRRQRVVSWEPHRLEVREGELGDLQPSVDGLLLCSDRLRASLQAASAPADVAQWLPVDITTPDGGTLPYWILLFPDPQPISDVDLAGPGVPFVPTPDFERMRSRAVFGLTSFSHFYVRSEVREAIERAGADAGIHWHRPRWSTASPGP